jgi:hypothetical protein
MARNKAATNFNLLPCISKGHTVWDVRRMRPWLGVELMMVQGFDPKAKCKFDPLDQGILESLPERIVEAIERMHPKWEVSDLDLKRMAGNTMTVPVMMLLQAFPVSPSTQIHRHPT